MAEGKVKLSQITLELKIQIFGRNLRFVKVLFNLIYLTGRRRVLFATAGRLWWEVVKEFYL